jgi:alkanesulfonate monooxygenase
MTLTFHWFLPTYGDSRYLVGGGHGTDITIAGRDRPADLGYLRQIASAAEQLGFLGVLTPTGAWCEDAWLTTAMLAGATERLKFLVAFRPGLLSPTLAAQMAATYQRYAPDRLLINIVTGGEDAEQRAFGDFNSKDERYQRTDEFLSVVRGLWRGERVTLDGQQVHIEEAKLARVPDPVPTLYFGGSSPAAVRVAAKHVDVYLTWGEPPSAVAAKIARLRAAAAEQGRMLRFGIRLHVISRDTSTAAWAEARRLLDALDPNVVADVQKGLSKSQSEGQQRMLALNKGSTENLEIYPNLWAGVGLVRGGAGTALVGSHAEVAERIEEYHALGIDEFILSGQPHLEEAYWFGEGVLPLLAAKGLWQHPAQPDQVPSTIPFADRTPTPTAS